jgi:hypothetical protein
MTNYANEVIFVLTPNGDELVYVTARNDYRTEKTLASEVPRYFGEGHIFVRNQIMESGLTKEEAEIGRRALLAYYEAMGRNTLNVKDAPMLMVNA